MSVRSLSQAAIRPPLRRCVSCREYAPKTALLRVVRMPSGAISVDSTVDGRGAYVHRDSQCIAAASSDARPLARALRRSPSESTLSSIAEIADHT